MGFLGLIEPEVPTTTTFNQDPEITLAITNSTDETINLSDGGSLFYSSEDDETTATGSLVVNGESLSVTVSTTAESGFDNIFSDMFLQASSPLAGGTISRLEVKVSEFEISSTIGIASIGLTVGNGSHSGYFVGFNTDETPSPTTPFWIVIDSTGDSITASLYESDPSLGSDPTSSESFPYSINPMVALELSSDTGSQSLGYSASFTMDYIKWTYSTREQVPLSAPYPLFTQGSIQAGSSLRGAIS